MAAAGFSNFSSPETTMSRNLFRNGKRGFVSRNLPPFHLFFGIEILRVKKSWVPLEKDIPKIANNVHVWGFGFCSNGAYIMMA
jgi:hypothetical protein